MLDEQGLRKLAKDAAHRHTLITSKNYKINSFLTLKQDEIILLKVFDLIENKIKGKSIVFPTAEWLFDNFYIIQEHIKFIRQNCDKKSIRELPFVSLEGDYILPRTYALGADIIKSTAGLIDERAVCIYIDEYQKTHSLSCREIWTIPLMMRIAIIKRISPIASRITHFYESDKPNSEKTDDQNLEEYKSSIENLVISLKFLSGIKWEEIFEDLSIVDKILAEDPAKIYTEMEFESRDYYRKKVESLARFARLDETAVARKAVNCAKRFAEGTIEDQRLKHVGYYLIGDGQQILINELNKKYSIIMKLSNWIYSNSFTFYLGWIFVLSAFFFAVLVNYSDFRRTPWLSIEYIVVFMLALIPVITVSTELVNRMITKIFPPARLPRLEFKYDISPEYRTMVIIPALLSNPGKTVELIKRLEIFYLANHSDNLHFAILGDLKDSKTQEKTEDEEIVKSALKAVNELNLRYCPEKNDIFFFFLRSRKWNITEKIWMGWERKRGAIVEFNRLLQGHNTTAFSVKEGNLKLLRDIKYVITLDSDTHLPRDTAKKLIGSIAHPLNKAVLSEDKKRVKSGFGILQPRIGISVESANRTYFSSLFTGQVGIDPYTTAVSDVYQDLFGEGIFTGKGIYDADIFFRLLNDTFPENSILSHDLLEGCFMRVGLITDVELVDGYPANFIAYSIRQHRWTRGDWQLIPWLFKNIRKTSEHYIKNPLSTICKWKITDNLRRSLVQPTLFLILCFGLIVAPASEFPWGWLFGVTILMPLIKSMFDFIPFIYTGIKSINTVSDFYIALKSAVLQILLSFCFLAFQAYIFLDAILRVLVRVFFTRKGLLEWVTAEDADKAFKGSLRDYIVKMWPSIALGVILTGLVGFLNNTLLFIAIPISLLWITAPVTAYFICKPKDEGVFAFSYKQINVLRRLARKTWRYFDEFVTSDGNWLPPDNYQEDPPKGAANRTSPTNIGLWLMSVISAYDLGFIGTLDAIERLERTILTMEKLKRWKGHFYNWYNIITLEPLETTIISSVDSGNLACYLIVLKESLVEMLEKPFNSSSEYISGNAHASFVDRCKNLCESIEIMFEGMDFKALYNEKIDFFSVGYDLSKDNLLKSHYDLLATEARQTSFIAIAKGHAPQKHWFRLGRALNNIGYSRSLLSWNGTMFEYLMPILLMKNYNATLLHETYIGASKAQKQYGYKRHIPWGISESAYYAFNIGMYYHYKAFGVPELALKKGLEKDLVIAPYATFLAMHIDPKASIRNLDILIAEGLEGDCGMYESIDYTPERVDEGNKGMIVKMYMSHHQGMIMMSIANCLNNNIMQQRFHKNQLVRATELLLQEKIPANEIS